MGDKDLPTFITDNFPLQLLECQYYDKCRLFNPKICNYGDPCRGYITLTTGDKVQVREIFRNSLEDFVEVRCLHYQIKLILDERKD